MGTAGQKPLEVICVNSRQMLSENKNYNYLSLNECKCVTQFLIFKNFLRKIIICTISRPLLRTIGSSVKKRL